MGICYLGLSENKAPLKSSGWSHLFLRNKFPVFNRTHIQYPRVDQLLLQYIFVWQTMISCRLYIHDSTYFDQTPTSHTDSILQRFLHVSNFSDMFRCLMVNQLFFFNTLGWFPCHAQDPMVLMWSPPWCSWSSPRPVESTPKITRNGR